MFNPIRELIAENKIVQALAACGDLDLTPANRSRLISLRRRWDLLAEQTIAQTREERLLRLEENGVVEDLLKWLDQMEYAPAKEEWSVKVTHTKQGGGAAAGAKPGPAKSNARWLWTGAATIALLAVIWMAWPGADPAPVAENPTRELPQDPPAESPTREEPSAPPAKEEPPTDGPIKPGTTRINPADLVATTPGKIDLSKVDISAVPLNKDIRLNSDALRKLAAANALMTAGDQVDIAVALYRNTKAPTKYDPVLSKALASYLMREAGALDVAPEVLTQKFHDHDKRERLQLRGTFEASGLNVKRARFLLLADIRNIDVRGKAELRLCLYDVERGRGFTRGSSINVGTSARTNISTGSRLKEKELFYAARDYLKEMKERGVLK